MESINKPNRLIDEDSPYLLLHAYNPVDWYPWGEEAFQKAKDTNKPIFLSIGYSSCHWCHVMEKESFTNIDIAKILNENFISIKVDREEHPEVDKFYQNVHVIFNNRTGGWPLSIFMTPELKPFFAATYIPLENKTNAYAFSDILHAISNQYKQDSSKLISYGNEILQHINSLNKVDGAIDISKDIVGRFFKRTEENFDEIYGGFSGAPKFPQTSVLDTLLYIFNETGNDKALFMVEHTLKNMARGGLYDLVDGGFCRYSVDEMWFIPHFEKMTYDNALLSGIYLDTYKITGDQFYLTIAAETIEFMLDKMYKDGLFYSSSDADSEGGEGKYFIYEYAEVNKIFDEYGIDYNILSVSNKGNFEGKNILRLSDENEREKVKPLLSELKDLRKHRQYPAIDNKIITSVNAMMIKSLFKLAKIDGKFESLAKNSFEKLMNFSYREGVFYHCGVHEKPVKIKAFLEDYAFFIDMLLEAYYVTKEDKFLEFAIKFTKDANLFFDDFWYFSNEQFKTISDIFDESYPSSASLMILNNIRLNQYVSGEFTDIINKSVKNYSAKISKFSQYAALSVKCVSELLKVR